MKSEVQKAPFATKPAPDCAGDTGIRGAKSGPGGIEQAEAEWKKAVDAANRYVISNEFGEIVDINGGVGINTLDEETGLYYYGARYYDPRTRVWQSVDPILEKYLPSGSPSHDNDLPGMGGVVNPLNLGLYAYSHQNPVKYLDPDGRLTIIVHGTGATDADYAKPGAAFNQAVSATFKESAVPINWSGNNTVSARLEGAAQLAKMISDHKFAKGEKLNIVAHSHGGNLVKAYTNIPGARKIDTLVNLGTPQRSDFQINAAQVDQYLSVFSNYDDIQTLGSISVGGAQRLGRFDTEALNIDASRVKRPLYRQTGGRSYTHMVDHSNLHTVDVWKQKIEPHINVE